MTTSTHRALLIVDVFTITENDIYILSNKYHHGIKYLYNHLPNWTINTNEKANGQMIEPHFFLQFMGGEEKENPEKYILFDFKTYDNALLEEISLIGVDTLFEDINFKTLFDEFGELPTYKNRGDKLGAPIYLIVDITWESSYDHINGGHECESYVDIVGYLDSECNKIMFNLNVVT